MQYTVGRFNVGDLVVYAREGFELGGTVQGYTVDKLVVVRFDNRTEAHMIAERLLNLQDL